MSLISGFNASTTPTSSAIPEKTQAVCLVTELEDAESKNSPGNWMLAATIEIVEGEYKGMKVFTNYNLQNSNPTAERIGRAQLAGLCTAIGVIEPKSNSELLNKPFRATFGKPQEFNGELQSRIQKYDPVGGSAGVTQNLGGGASSQQQPGTNKPAWAKPAGA
jgi:hypothetical protein